MGFFRAKMTFEIFFEKRMVERRRVTEEEIEREIEIERERVL